MSPQREDENILGYSRRLETENAALKEELKAKSECMEGALSDCHELIKQNAVLKQRLVVAEDVIGRLGKLPLPCIESFDVAEELLVLHGLIVESQSFLTNSPNATLFHPDGLAWTTKCHKCGEFTDPNNPVYTDKVTGDACCVKCYAPSDYVAVKAKDLRFGIHNDIKVDFDTPIEFELLAESIKEAKRSLRAALDAGHHMVQEAPTDYVAVLKKDLQTLGDASGWDVDEETYRRVKAAIGENP